MSNPYGHRGRYHGAPPHPSGDDGASSAQASDYDQDASAPQGPYDYPYSTQQTTQQSIENPVSCSNEQHPHQHEDPGKYSDEQYNLWEEDSYGYSEKDPYSDSEDMEEGSDDYAMNDTTLPDAFQRPSENSRLHPHQVPDAYQAQGSYPAAGPASGKGIFESPGFTSWGDRPGPSQPYATSQMEGSWDSAPGVPALHNPMQNPYTSVEQPVAEFERPTSETVSHSSPQQQWEVRHEVASETNSALNQGPWRAGEVEKLKGFKRRNPTSWAGVEKAIVGRTKYSAQMKWKRLQNPRYHTDPDHATPQPSQPDGQAGRAPMTPEEFEQVKCWYARGYTYAWIGVNCDPRRTATGIQKILDRKKYKRWTCEQDNHLLKLQIENHGNLAEIRRKFSGPERSEGEIFQRLQYIEEGRPEEWKLQPQHPDGSSRDENYVRLQLAEGIIHSQMAKNVLATPIGAAWSEEED